VRLTRAEFEQAVRDALDTIPQRFHEFLDRVVVDIADRPDTQTLRELEVDDPADLLGAYFGTPLTDRGVEDAPNLPDRIVIYQRNVEAAAESYEELVEEIATTVLHEIGHHFGLDEDELEDLGYG